MGRSIFQFFDAFHMKTQWYWHTVHICAQVDLNPFLWANIPKLYPRFFERNASINRTTPKKKLTLVQAGAAKRSSSTPHIIFGNCISKYYNMSSETSKKLHENQRVYCITFCKHRTFFVVSTFLALCSVSLSPRYIFFILLFLFIPREDNGSHWTCSVYTCIYTCINLRGG